MELGAGAGADVGAAGAGRLGAETDGLEAEDEAEDEAVAAPDRDCADAGACERAFVLRCRVGAAWAGLVSGLVGCALGCSRRTCPGILSREW